MPQDNVSLSSRDVLFRRLSIVFNVLFAVSLIAWPIAFFISAFIFDAGGPPPTLYGLFYIAIYSYPIVVIASLFAAHFFRKRDLAANSLIISILPSVNLLLAVGILAYQTNAETAAWQPNSADFLCPDGTYLRPYSNMVTYLYPQEGSKIPIIGTRYFLEKEGLEINGFKAESDESSVDSYNPDKREELLSKLRTCKNGEGKSVADFPLPVKITTSDFLCPDGSFLRIDSEIGWGATAPSTFLVYFESNGLIRENFGVIHSAMMEEQLPFNLQNENYVTYATEYIRDEKIIEKIKTCRNQKNEEAFRFLSPALPGGNDFSCPGNSFISVKDLGFAGIGAYYNEQGIHDFYIGSMQENILNWETDSYTKNELKNQIMPSCKNTAGEAFTDLYMT